MLDEDFRSIEPPNARFFENFQARATDGATNRSWGKRDSLNDFGPFGWDWFDTWHEEEGGIDHEVGLGWICSTVPNSRLGEHRWTPEQIDARARELCSLDPEPIAKSDLAATYRHLHDVDEAVHQIKDDWPVRKLNHSGYHSTQASVIPAQRLLRHQYGSVNDELEHTVRLLSCNYNDDDDDDTKVDDDNDVDNDGGMTLYTDEEYQAKFHVDLAKRLLQRHNHLRTVIQERSKAHLRPLRLNDMPNKVISHIVNFLSPDEGEKFDRWAPKRVPRTCRKPLKSWEYETPKWTGGDLKAVQALRLTCRSLADIAAPAIIRRVTVRLTSESLDRLDYISRHPHFSKGVKHVRIAAPYYDPGISDSPALFILYAIFLFKSAFSECDEGSPDTRRRRRKRKRQSHTHSFGQEEYDLCHVVDGWRKLVQPVCDQNDVPVLSTAMGPEWRSAFQKHTLLVEAYETYRRNYAEHELVLSGRNFADAVSTALSRMPNAECVTVSDLDFERCRHISHGRMEGCRMATREEMLDLLARPMAWDYLEGHRIVGHNHAACMVAKLLPTLGSRGIRLKYVEILVTPPADLSYFQTPNESSRQDFIQAMSEVQYLKFTIADDCGDPQYPASRSYRDGVQWPARSAQQLAALDGYLDCLLDSDSLRAFELDFVSLREENGGSPDGWYLPSLMKARPWPRLRKITLTNVCLSSLELDGFLRKGPLLIADLHRPHMSRGTWAQALDIMRRKYDPDWKLRSVWDPVDDGLKGLSLAGILWQPTGGECLAMEDDYIRAFSIPLKLGRPSTCWISRFDTYSRAQKYISHLQDENPCRPCV